VHNNRDTGIGPNVDDNDFSAAARPRLMAATFTFDQISHVLLLGPNRGAHKVSFALSSSKRKQIRLVCFCASCTFGDRSWARPSTLNSSRAFTKASPRRPALECLGSRNLLIDDVERRFNSPDQATTEKIYLSTAEGIALMRTLCASVKKCPPSLADGRAGAPCCMRLSRR
jgi:hypothetical protein